MRDERRDFLDAFTTLSAHLRCVNKSRATCFLPQLLAHACTCPFSDTLAHDHTRFQPYLQPFETILHSAMRFTLLLHSISRLPYGVIIISVLRRPKARTLRAFHVHHLVPTQLSLEVLSSSTISCSSQLAHVDVLCCCSGALALRLSAATRLSVSLRSHETHPASTHLLVIDTIACIRDITVDIFRCPTHLQLVSAKL
jgi:hypothetical protein